MAASKKGGAVPAAFSKVAGKARKEATKHPANKPGRSGKARPNKAQPFGKKKD